MEIGTTITISMISALMASYFTYFFGFRRYLKEKAREEVRGYYVKNGIDRVIEILSKSSFLCDFNFARAIRILEYLQKSLMDRKNGEREIKKIFAEMQNLIIAPLSATYKIQLITDQHKELFSWIIEALADYSKYIDFLKHELYLETNFYFQNPEKFIGKEQILFDQLKKRINESYKFTSSHEPLKAHLLNLRIRIDEIGISSMKDFDKKIPKDRKIKKILEEIRRDYEKIKKNRKLKDDNKNQTTK